MRTLRGVFEAFDAAPASVVHRVRQAAWVVLGLGVFALLIVGASTAARPRLVPPPGRVSLGQAALEVRTASGVRISCALLANTAGERAAALVGRRSLGGDAAVVSAFDTPTTAPLVTAGVDLPLSVAWFDASGRYLGERDVGPCAAGARLCPRYAPPGRYQFSVATRRGSLGALGIGPGATAALGGPCSG